MEPTRQQAARWDHFITHVEVVMTNEQRLPNAVFLGDGRWNYLQSFIFRVARLSVNTPITQEHTAMLDELKMQGCIIAYAVKVIPQ